MNASVRISLGDYSKAWWTLWKGISAIKHNQNFFSVQPIRHSQMTLLEEIMSYTATLMVLGQCILELLSHPGLLKRRILCGFLVSMPLSLWLDFPLSWPFGGIALQSSPMIKWVTSVVIFTVVMELQKHNELRS